jgi:hypothetical protein
MWRFETLENASVNKTSTQYLQNIVNNNTHIAIAHIVINMVMS